MRFIADVMTGVPSITIGIFGYIAIAKNFGYTADELSLPVEKFMRDYYLHARVVHRVSRRLIARCRETLSQRATVQRRLRQEALGRGRASTSPPASCPAARATARPHSAAR